MKVIRNYRRIIAFVIAVSMVLCGCNRGETSVGVSIVEFDTIEALAAVDINTLKDSENTLYKVGDNYYAFFPSTGQMELVTQVQEYDEKSITVIEALYNGTVTANGEATEVNEAYVTSVNTLGSVLETRTEYLERELDNCNANLLLDGADVATLEEYKQQLEAELAQLAAYKQSLSNITELVVQSLQSSEVQDALLKQISEMLDKQLVTFADQYAYNQHAGLATDADLTALEQMVLTQQTLIEVLQEKYSDVDAILANKRVALVSAEEIIDSDEFKTVLAHLDMYAASYVKECERLYNSLSTKAAAFESLYSTIQNTDGADYDAVLQELRIKYTEMLQTQADLQKQIDTLTSALSNVETNTVETTADGVYDVLQTQLDKHEAELDALEDILAGSNLATIDGLATVQTTLQERITSLETLQNSLKETMTQQQIDALNALKSEIETNISNGTADIETTLRGYIETLTGSYDSLDAETQAAIDALRRLLADSAAEQSAINSAVDTLITNLGANLETQQVKLEEQKTMLVDLIGTTTEQVQTELTTALETSVATQEQKLAAQREALTALISSSDEELSATLQGMFTAQLGDSTAELDATISELAQALEADSGATDEEIAALRAALQDKFSEAVTAAETQLAQEKGALETLIETQKAATIAELKGVIDTVDGERQADIESLIAQLESSNNTNSAAITAVKTELQGILAEDIAEQEGKLTAAKEALVALMSTKDDALSEVLVGKIAALDEDVQEDMQVLIDALDAEVDARDAAIDAAVDSETAARNEAIDAAVDSETAARNDAIDAAVGSETAARNEAIETAKAAVTASLRTSIAEQEAALDTTTSALNSFMTATNASVGALESTTATLKSTTATLTGDLTTLSEDFTALTNAYDAYTQANSTTVTGINDALTELTGDYSTYTQNNTAAVGALNTALDTLDSDYAQYKEQTGNTIASIEALLSTVKGVTDTNAESVAGLNTALTELKNGAVADLQTTQTALNSALTTLSETVTANYAELTAEVTRLATAVTTLTTDVATLTTDVASLKGTVPELSAKISALDTSLTTIKTTLTDIQTALDGKADVDDIPAEYVLPVATATEIGGVSVDGDTIMISSDGKLYVNTAAVSQTTPGEVIDVGTVWANYEDIPAAYRDYCIQANFLYSDTAPTEVLYKEVQEEWYLYSKAYANTSYTGSTCPEPTETAKAGATTYTTCDISEEVSGVAWYLSAKRPTTYDTLEKVPVTLYYYGFADGAGGNGVIWTQYAVYHGITKTETQTVTTTTARQNWYATNKIDSNTVALTYFWAKDGDTTTTQTTHTNTRTYLDGWLGDYDTYGPESGFKPAAFKGAYFAGCEMNTAQRTKLWDSGVLDGFALTYYNADYAAAASATQAEKYAVCKHNMVNALAEYGSTTVTNETTTENLPANLSSGVNTGAGTSNLKYPYNVYNFTEAGLAYKLAYLYGNHCWMYVGTPS